MCCFLFPYSIEFDRDFDYFAIAGVTKKIKVLYVKETILFLIFFVFFVFLLFFFSIQLYWTYTRTVNIRKRQSTTKQKLRLKADKKET